MADDDGRLMAQDPRVAYLQDFVVEVTKVKLDRWEKCVGNPEFRPIILSFFEDGSRLFLVFFQNKDKNDELTPSFTFPTGLRKKAIVFYKTEACSIDPSSGSDKKGLARNIRHSELGATPVEQLKLLVQSVYLPLVESVASASGIHAIESVTSPGTPKGDSTLHSGKNPDNDSNLDASKKWPKIVAADVLKHFHKYVTQLGFFVAQTKGDVLLVVPSSVDLLIQEGVPVNAMAQDRVLVHSLESAVVDWARQIKKVLDMDSIKDLHQMEATNHFPGASSEVEFWSKKMTLVNSIVKELGSDKLKASLKVLELSRSSFISSFKKVFEDLVEEKRRVEDIVKFLETTRETFARLENTDDVRDLPRIYKPLLHLLLLIWKHSKYCGVAPRIVVIIRKVCNDVVRICASFVDGGSILKQEGPEALEKLECAQLAAVSFKQAFFQYKGKVNSAHPDRPWRFENKSIFSRLDAFVERVQDIFDLIRMIGEFQKLEKVEVGGIKGHTLTAMVEKVRLDFESKLQPFLNIEYDLFDFSDSRFDDSYGKFCLDVREMDQRLCYVIEKAFEETSSSIAAFKIIDSFETQIARETIRAQIKVLEPRLMRLFEQDLDAVSNILLSSRIAGSRIGETDGPAILSNLPKVSGTMSWSRALLERMTWPLDRLVNLDSTIFDSHEGQLVHGKYDRMVSILKSYEDDIYGKWSSEVANVSTERLHDFVLRRNEKGLLEVNFDIALSRCIQEVKYLHILSVDVPEPAQDLFTNREEYRKYGGNLAMVVSQYNSAVRMLVEVERPLVQSRLVVIDAIIDRGLNHISWKSAEIGSFMEDARVTVKDLFSRVNALKGNIRTIEKMMLGWGDLFRYITISGSEKSNRGRQNGLIELIAFWRTSSDIAATQHFSRKVFSKWRARTSLLLTSASDIPEHGNRIQEVIESIRERLEVASGTAEWSAFLSHMSLIIFAGIREAIRKSLSLLARHLKVAESVSDLGLSELQQKKTLEQLQQIVLQNAASCGAVLPVNTPVYAALLEMKLSLQDGKSVYTPHIDGGFSSLQERVISWIDAAFSLGKRIRKPSSPADNYAADIEKVGDLSQLREECMSSLAKSIEKCVAVRSLFDQFSFLYEQDRSAVMRKFLDGSVPEASNAEDKQGPKKPTLTDFDERISYFGNLIDKIQLLPASVHFGWLRVDAQPLRSALATEAGKWRHMFLVHLEEHVVSSVTNVSSFVSEVTVGLQKEVPPGNYDKLVAAMDLLYQVRSRNDEFDGLFDPLKDTVALLRKYNRSIDDEILAKLEILPESWSSCKKLCVAVKEKLAPLQVEEVRNVQQAEVDFSDKIMDYRKDFARRAPYAWDEKGLRKAYESLDVLHVELLALEKELVALNEKQNLFELLVNNGRSIKECRADVFLLKQLWDIISLTVLQIDEWKNLSFLKMDTSIVEEETKKFYKEVRNADKKAKSWDAYRGLESLVKNFLTCLPLVSDLRSPSMRDRHWNALMKTTGVQFQLTDDFRLADLLALELHKYVEDVESIVERANKELSMEKSLRELTKTWATMTFEFGRHRDTDIPIIKVTEEIIETLEDNQVQLQNMMASKYIAIFQDEVESWQRKLSSVDSAISLFVDVQRTWAYLENIFIGSEDIRRQLPEDSARFERLDNDLKGLLRDAERTPRIVDACCKDGLDDALSRIQDQLSKCEKSLSEYLETKRKAFPRFYFVSVPDLLDILSKGGQSPHAVMSHMPKLFQAIQKLDFAKEGSTLTNNAVGMISREGEVVGFDSACSCVGQVELWLNRVVEAIRFNLNKIIQSSVYAYEEKPRESWLLDFPAQVVLLTTQIYWATEVSHAFESLEDGNENALKDYNKKQIQQLHNLIKLVQGDLKKGDRMTVMCLVTLDVHARDVIQNVIRDKVESSSAFAWQSQLRPRWDDAKKECFINICDAEFVYGYEYLGNGPRLVITPLTDRIYITATQSLHLIMGCAPAGPAGTGKTETTKDLGSQVGKPVYVFNCSDQMDYKSLGNIFKGLASSGAWGCFDEFNRISVEVLSVVSTQFKSILDAIRECKTRFNFQGEDIALDLTCGAFITMNPGYLGRTELPESLKALFRPVTVVVPDLELICENMLMAEGFVNARVLAKKFITLYSLCRDLLSKQDHYDWGLRAIKSVLVVAGSLRRAEPHIDEEMILMRALRDFNLPKIVADDLSVFMGLINDLFPGLELPRKRDMTFEETIRQCIVEKGWQPEESLILKVVQLEELLTVRHSVFVLGPSGAGKSVVWKSLAASTTKRGKKTTCKDLNPKAITSNELYGYINPATREWEDGLLSSIMRDLGRVEDTNPKWIILDGDLDTEWIESMNSVMDDNKILTLASNERIPLLDHMRLLFEISHLKYATPATVSRAGILYVAEQDIGWMPFVQSWIERREDVNERTHLQVLVERYLPLCVSYVRKNFKSIVPVSDISSVENFCVYLNGLLPLVKPGESDKDVYELLVVFSCVWAFGGPLTFEDNVDYRLQFSRWWKGEFKTVKYPEAGTVFDYYVKNVDGVLRFEKWNDLMSTFVYDPEVPLSSVMVPTVETSCLEYFMDMLIRLRHPVLLVGPAGSGKTKLVSQKVAKLPEDQIMTTKINFNYYTDARTLQAIMERPLEKKAGRNYGPPGTKRMIYFVDDLNMPYVDNYGTQTPIALIRQHVDYSHWYDRKKLTLKDVHNCQYLAAMNPSAGSFFVDPRLQRHFATFAVSLPSRESLQTIYVSILDGHLQQNFAQGVKNVRDKIVSAALDLHKKVTDTFLKTAIKFHYEFNLRHLSDIFQGILLSRSNVFTDVRKLTSLWIHEACRVYGDRLVDEDDRHIFLKEVLLPTVRKNFPDFEADVLIPTPLVFSHFARGYGTEKVYDEVSSFQSLAKTLNDALNDYNETNAVMNLVLFEDAMSHVCRISRIIENPAGHALLVGVGGSGKQSLSRLAAFISGYTVTQITISRSYGINELKEDLKNMYMKVGLKSESTVFLFTDSQIVDERFLVFLNDLLSSGNIPDLFATDEIDTIVNGIRSEVKQAGVIDTRDNCWDFFIEKVRRNLHVVLCFSPVGDALRVRARKFPALVSCTVIDWFQPWPREALVSVANRFLEDVDLGSKENQAKVVEFMAFAHQSVDDASKELLVRERRYNYTTPKSFLELIAFYKNLLSSQRSITVSKIERLEAGLVKLRKTSDDVAELEENLKRQQVIVEDKKAAVEKLLKQVAHETAIVEAENAKAQEEADVCNKIAREVSGFQQQCQEELKRAEPAIIAAEAALNTLNKGNLTELKSFKKPTQEVADVLNVVLILLSPKSGVTKDRSWSAAQKAMANVDQFLKTLQTYDKENIPAASLQAAQPFLTSPNFNGEYLKSKSSAAAGICEWARNTVIYYDIFCEVEPKRLKLAEANAQLDAANTKLRAVQAEVAALQAKLRDLEERFEKANAEKLAVQEQAEKTQNRLSLAQRLVRALASENVRWAENIKKLQQALDVLVGDVLVSAAFVSYIGAFTFRFRKDLLNDRWIPKLKDIHLACSPTVDPLALLTDDAAVAGWNNLGLPADRVSIENGTIFTRCERWPLIIDPQLQGVSFVKNLYGDRLKVMRLGQNRMLDMLENAIKNGHTVLIENIQESIDAVLQPILSRQVIRKGRDLFVRLGDKEVEYDPKFRLILQTKLSNPHYKPEIQAETQLTNFMVTEDGLEEQLLALVVKKERPDLEEQKAGLIKQQNEFKIRLKELEDNLLERLSKAEGDILGDISLIENLEVTKATSNEIEEKVKLAKKTEIDINKARELYRPVASRGSLLYFLLDALSRIEVMYQFSLNSFVVVFSRAIDTCSPAEEVAERVAKLIDNVTWCVFTYARRGLFEKHKLVFSADLCFRIMLKSKELDPLEVTQFIAGRRPAQPPPNPLSDWLDDALWANVQGLRDLEGFERLADDMEGSAKRWREWAETEQPEKEKLPQDWKNKTEFQKLLVIRSLRPDRTTHAVRDFVQKAMGSRFVEQTPFSLEATFFESSPSTPLFFILFPGADPVKDAEALGRKLGFSEDNGKFRNVSLGQGQEVIAEQALEKLSKTGGWVMLQNIHLMKKWLPSLERSLESLSESAHKDFRVFLTAEPADHIPQGILQNSLKITNEAPQTLKANLLRAYANFNQDTLESCMKQTEFKTILFTLCFFHALVLGRRKFGFQGWSRAYSFNTGDLTISANVLFNYLEANNNVPWEDIRYMFGEIMYGGHITDKWDRRTCSTYLETLMMENLLEGSFDLGPGFVVPPVSSYPEYVTYIEESLPQESPPMFGLHPNAEINFLNNEADSLFRLLTELEGGGAVAAGESRESKVRQIIEDIMRDLPENYDVAEMIGRIEERTPYISVVLQECDRMNILIREIRMSLRTLEMGLRGELTVSEQMERIMNALFVDRVPDSWSKVAYPSLKPLGSWYGDLLKRVQFLAEWSNDLNLPKSVWLSGLFSPLLFLSAVMQTTARKQDLPLDKMCLMTDVTKKGPEEVGAAPRDGAYIHGLFLEGARWDTQAGCLKDSILKQLHPALPVIYVKAMLSEKRDLKGTYECPVYATSMRGATYVTTAYLKSQDKPHKWVLAGVCGLLSPE
eukprot:ANDGO_04168.mRNA.1 Dynein beta chain